MLSATTPVPEPLERYPNVDASERASLHGWLKTLSARNLVVLLADKNLEPKLIALKREELRIDAGRAGPEARSVAGAIICGVIGLGILAAVCLPLW